VTGARSNLFFRSSFRRKKKLTAPGPPPKRIRPFAFFLFPKINQKPFLPPARDAREKPRRKVSIRSAMKMPLRNKKNFNQTKKINQKNRPIHTVLWGASFFGRLRPRHPPPKPPCPKFKKKGLDPATVMSLCPRPPVRPHYERSQICRTKTRSCSKTPNVARTAHINPPPLPTRPN